MNKVFFLFAIVASIAYGAAPLLTQEQISASSNTWQQQKQGYINWVKNDVTNGMPQTQQNEIINNLTEKLNTDTYNHEEFTKYYEEQLQKNQAALSDWIDAGGMSSSSTLSAAGGCACAGVINSAFQDMKNYIINDKIKKLQEAITAWDKTVQQNIAEQKAKNELIKTNIEQNARKSFYYQKLLHQYKKGNLIE